MNLTPHEQHQMGRKHIFCINGASEFLDFVRLLFEDADYNVTTTNFVPHTFDQILALNPSMLIIDLEVGRRAGFALLERLRSEVSTRQIPIMIVSTDQRLLDEAHVDQERYGGQVFLGKPFDIQEMLDHVQATIGPA